MAAMTNIVDPKKTIKTPEMGEKWREILTKKYQIESQINVVNEKITQLVI